MELERIYLENFRNYGRQEIRWHPQVNLIQGDNAQGKSNLLEAVAYLSLASSFRGATDGEMLGWEQPYFHIQGEVGYTAQGGGKVHLAVGYSREKRKSWKINGQSQRRLGAVLGHFHTVIFSPEDLLVVKSGPLARRRYLNRQLLQLEPGFYGLMLRYNQVVKQRNSLLKLGYRGLREMLAPWNQQLAQYGAQIYQRRLEIFGRLQRTAAEIHHKLCPQEELQLRYQGFLPQAELNVLTQPQLEEALLQRLQQAYPEEKARRTTVVGPHRDDLLILINGENARRFGSQGQQRSAALALKLAELELAYAERGEYPALLLDDVMSELDEKRRSQLLELMTGKAQTFITATDVNFTWGEGKRFEVVAGEVRETGGTGGG